MKKSKNINWIIQLLLLQSSRQYSVMLKYLPQKANFWQGSNYAFVKTVVLLKIFERFKGCFIYYVRKVFRKTNIFAPWYTYFPKN